MRTHNIPSCYRKSEILNMPSDLALLSTLISSNYPCLELIVMVPKVFEPLKFDCILILFESHKRKLALRHIQTRKMQVVMSIYTG